MIFKTVNATIEKKAYNVYIKNIDLAMGHWWGEKEIVNFFDEIETLLHNEDDFQKNFTMLVCDLVKYNRRIEDLKFFDVPEENRVVVCAFTKVKKFKEFDTFSREMSGFFKHQKKTFSIVEIIFEEWEEIKKGEKKFPENWKPNEYMQSKFDKLKDFI